MRICTFETCDRPWHSKGLCTGHYEMKRTIGYLKPLAFQRGQNSVRDSLGRKRCNTCREWYPEADFNKSKREPDKLRARCKHCLSKARAVGREQRALERIPKFFNITVEERDEMLLAQDNRCAACGTLEPGAKGWVIDHDHGCCPRSGRSCGKCIRGLLCSRCNLVLGGVGDSIETLQGMISYLDRRPALRLVA